MAGWHGAGNKQAASPDHSSVVWWVTTSYDFCSQVQLAKVAIGSRPKLLWPAGRGAGSPASGDPETPTGGGESESSTPSSPSKRPLLG